ncbi:MAG: glycosyltransferase family 2 protein [Nitrospinota bacterium]
MKKLSIVVPAYNEETAIKIVLDDIRAVMDGTGISYEVIVVDDGSTDATSDRVRETDATLITQEENRGYGAALKRGIRQAEADMVLTIDGDSSYPVTEIPNFLAAADACDMVVGARLGRWERRETPRRMARWLLNTLAGYLLETNIPDINSGMRLLKREVVMDYFHLLPSKFSFTTTLTLAMLSDRLRVHHVPIGYRKRLGKSKIRPLQDAFNFLVLIIRTVVYFNPLKVFLPISLLLCALGLGVLAWRVIVHADIAQLEILTLLLGVQVGLFGLLADIVVRRAK